MVAIAIDFGTSNTVVCILDPVTQAPRTLKFDQLSRQFETAVRTVTVVPTVAFVQSPEAVLIGETVRSRRLGFAQPERYFQAFKRDLVADFQAPPRLIDRHAYTAADIATVFLTEIWRQVQQQVQPSQVIFTAPVGAFEQYLNWFRDLAETLQMPAVQLVDESTAAALGYAVQRPGSLVLVVDLGGGTLDLSLIRTVANRKEAVLRAEVLAKSDAYVGGIDIDTWLVEAYLQQLGTTRAEIGEIGWQNLLEITESLKIRLSREPEVKESWFDDETFTAHALHFTRQQLEDILEDRQFLEQLRQALDELLAVALGKGISKAAIEQVLLVGGSCQIPAVQQLIVSYFGRQRVKLSKPFEAIAHGALVLSQTVAVDDHLRHSYAIRLWDPYTKTYTYYPLFQQGTAYPCKRAEPLMLQVATESQREIRLDIGEVATVSAAEVTFDRNGRMTSTHLNRQDSFRSLDTNHNQVCVAHLNPPGQVGVDRIAVQFEVNKERVLLATVRDLLTDVVLVERGAIAKL